MIAVEERDTWEKIPPRRRKDGEKMELNKKNILRILLIVAISLLMFWLLTHFNDAATIFGGFIALISPFLLGFAMAFIINVLMRPMEKLWNKLWHKRKGKWVGSLRRPVCMLVSILLIFALLTFITLMVVPELSRTMETLISVFPQFLQQLSDWWDQVTAYLSRYSITLPEHDFNMEQLGESVTGFFNTTVPQFFSTTVGITTSIFSGIFNFVLGIVFAIYLLGQKEKLGRQMRKVLHAYLPRQKADRVLEIAELSNKTFSNFVTGQLMEACIIGILCFVGMTIFSIPYALMVSVLVGFTALIPVFGAFIGTAIGAFLILMVDPMKAVGFVIFIIVLQQLESNLIYPRVVGKSVGLSGIWVLAAVTIGGGLFGVWGMLISVPLCSVLYVLWGQNINHRLREKEAAQAAADAVEPSAQSEKTTESLPDSVK